MVPANESACRRRRGGIAMIARGEDDQRMRPEQDRLSIGQGGDVHTPRRTNAFIIGRNMSVSRQGMLLAGDIANERRIGRPATTLADVAWH
jgi:hypothetical protein